jgi:hypothetical protein
MRHVESLAALERINKEHALFMPVQRVQLFAACKDCGRLRDDTGSREVLQVPSHRGAVFVVT